MARLNKEKRIDLAENSSDPAELEKLAGDKVDDVREAVAENSNTPASVLEKLAGDEEDVRANVAQNPNTPVSVLEKLAGDEEDYVRMGVPCNPNTPASVLEKLAGDDEWGVRQGVAENLNTTASILVKLAGDEDEEVRFNVALNPNTPVSILETLAGDEDCLVRISVAKNPNAPVSLLEKLAGVELDEAKKIVSTLGAASNHREIFEVLKKFGAVIKGFDDDLSDDMNCLELKKYFSDAKHVRTVGTTSSDADEFIAEISETETDLLIYLENYVNDDTEYDDICSYIDGDFEGSSEQFSLDLLKGYFQNNFLYYLDKLSK